MKKLLILFFIFQIFGDGGWCNSKDSITTEIICALKEIKKESSINEKQKIFIFEIEKLYKKADKEIKVYLKNLYTIMNMEIDSSEQKEEWIKLKKEALERIVEIKKYLSEIEIILKLVKELKGERQYGRNNE